jgi:hypothetical protein
MRRDFDLICTICCLVTVTLVNGCGKFGTFTIDDDSAPLSDGATYQSTVEVLEEGLAESYIKDLEEGEVLVGGESDAFVCQGTVPDLKPDWDTILSENPDTVAYLVIPEAGITVPVMRKAGDQTYYDTHNAKGNIQEGGALHLDIGNNADYTDPNTIIYGCNESGGPLEYLEIYGNPEYFEANPFIYLYIPGYVLEFRVFAAMSGGDTDILTNTNCYDYDVFSRYIEQIYASRSMDLQKADYLKEAVVNGWRMLTISAGSTTDSANRYFVYSTFSGSQIQ